MIKPEEAVKRETAYVAAGTGVLSLLMQSVFLILGRWDYTVLLGNLLTGGAGVLNFFFMGLTVQKAVTLEPQKASERMKTSQTLRFFALFLVLLAGVLAPCFHIVAVLVALFFPRIAVAFRRLFHKETDETEAESHE